MTAALSVFGIGLAIWLQLPQREHFTAIVQVELPVPPRSQTAGNNAAEATVDMAAVARGIASSEVLGPVIAATLAATEHRTTAPGSPARGGSINEVRQRLEVHPLRSRDAGVLRLEIHYADASASRALNFARQLAAAYAAEHRSRILRRCQQICDQRTAAAQERRVELDRARIALDRFISEHLRYARRPVKQTAALELPQGKHAPNAERIRAHADGSNLTGAHERPDEATRLERQFQELTAQRTSLVEQFTSDHPHVKALDARLEQITRQLESALDQGPAIADVEIPVFEPASSPATGPESAPQPDEPSHESNSPRTDAPLPPSEVFREQAREIARRERLYDECCQAERRARQELTEWQAARSGIAGPLVLVRSTDLVWHGLLLGGIVAVSCLAGLIAALARGGDARRLCDGQDLAHEFGVTILGELPWLDEPTPQRQRRGRRKLWPLKRAA